MVESARLVRVEWLKYFRIIRTAYPQIELFEDVQQNPADWESVIESKYEEDATFWNSAGILSNVPPTRRVGGSGASWVMSPFVHNSPSRFSNGSYGIFYAGNSEQVAIDETIYHHERQMSDFQAVPNRTSDFQLLVGSIATELHDVDHVPGTRDPDDYNLSQQAGMELRNAGSDGVTWRRLRHTAGRCIGVYWPDVVTIPVATARYSYHWDGARVDLIMNQDTRKISRRP